MLSSTETRFSPATPPSPLSTSVLEGKVVGGHWTPGRLNRILGRQLECGQRAWYVRLAGDIGVFLVSVYNYYLLGNKYDLHIVYTSGGSSMFIGTYGIRKRKAKIV